MLTDPKIKDAKAKDKSYKLTDSNGLFLEVPISGRKKWRYRYRIDGKENTFALGEYVKSPIGETAEQATERIKSRMFTLSEARKERERCRGLVKQGIHPAIDQKKTALRQRLESDNTFFAVANAWFQDADYGGQWSAGYRKQVTSRLTADAFPYIGDLPIKEVKSPHVLDIMDRVKKRSAVQANLIKTWIGGVFRYAAGRLLVDYDPTYPLRGKKLPKVQHHPHLETKEIGAFLRAMEGVNADLSTMAACKLLWLTVLRTKNIRFARWEDIDFDEALWRIPEDDMKTGQAHIVPLCRQAIEILQSVKALGRNSAFIFPGRSSWEIPMSHESFRDIFKRAGYEGKFTPHGVRGTFSTHCNNLGIRSEVIELSLAHQEQNAIRRAYNHAKLLPERKSLMQDWADTLDTLKAGGKIIPIRAAG